MKTVYPLKLYANTIASEKEVFMLKRAYVKMQCIFHFPCMLELFNWLGYDL